MSATWRLVCAGCGRRVEDGAAWRCSKCGGAAIIRYDSETAPRSTVARRGVWRYAAWLPVAASALEVTLGEGDTPLLRLERWPERLGLGEVYAKLDSCCPTGSFKDRGAAVLISDAVARGAQLIMEDSSGNAGAAIAAYAARAGVGCRVFVPQATPAAKLRQMQAYGARVELVQGPRERSATAAADAARAPYAYYAGHNANPYFVEGMKTLAYELSEAFRSPGPDHLIMPVGGGSLFLGAWLGFTEWASEGHHERIPRFHLVQAAGCMPLVAALQTGADRAAPIRRTPTIAGGIEIERPPRDSMILSIVRRSGGSGVAVDDDEILTARRELAELEGIFMEPTSAAAFAGLRRLAGDGIVKPADSVVVAVTGSGLKDP